MRLIVAQRSLGRARSGQAGWSLIELLAGFSILTVVSTFSLPSVENMMETYRLRAATRRVYAELQSLRAGAVSTNTRQRLTSDGYGGLSFEHFDLETGLWVDSGVVAHELADVTVTLPGDIVFAPDGTAPESGTVDVADRDGRHRNVVVSVAGLIRVAP